MPKLQFYNAKDVIRKPYGFFTLSETENNFCSETDEMAESSQCDWLLLSILSVSLLNSFSVSLSMNTPLERNIFYLKRKVAAQRNNKYNGHSIGHVSDPKSMWPLNTVEVKRFNSAYLRRYHSQAPVLSPSALGDCACRLGSLGK